MMAHTAGQWGRQALDFADAVERLNAPDAVKLFESEINARGFHVYLHPPIGARADAGLAGKTI
jgi:hypothetical protein